MAVTDDERRLVAERLRMSDERDAAGFDCLLAEVVRGREFCETPCEECRARLLGELADLIEPSCDRDAERTCRDTDCDTESITCSECGEITRYTLFWVDVDGGKTVKGHRPRFCSNCGRMVLYDSNDYI